MLSRYIARRYLFSRQSRSVVNLISGLSVAAVAVPVAAMVILLSVFNGFETLVRSMYSAFDADLTVTPRRGQHFSAGDLDTAALRRIPGVTALSFTLEQSVLLEHEGRQATATLRGVDDGYGEVFDLSEAVVTGEWRVRLGDLERLVIGQSMAWMLGIRSLADADVTLYAVRRGSFSTLLPMDNYTRRTEPVGGVYVLDLDTERTYVLTSLRLAQALFEQPDRVSSAVIRLTPGADLERTRRSVAAAVGEDFRTQTRDELRASFYRIMTYEKWGIFFIALLVLVIASFSVVGALSMLIVEKRGDMATLRALGADTGLLRSIFRTEGLLICALGGAIGLTLGVVLSLLQQHFGLIEIPAESFLTKSYPVEFRFLDLVAVAAAFTVVSVVLTNVTVRSMIKDTTIRS
ncbi:ABC transporter permease [Alistipes sp.]|uniref:ABC transporter permease n=1 Tax=Alistipes sp. TaxID=1872444 RepID=UPI003A899840